MSLLALNVFVFSILAQPGVAAAPAPVDLYRLAREVMLLSEIAPLRLSQQQVKALLAVYRAAGRLAQPDSAIVGQLQQLRQRLLGGEPVAAKDIQGVLAGLPVEVRRGGMGRGGAPSDLVDKAVAVLEDWQQAILANRSGLTLQQIIDSRANPPTAQTAQVLIAIAGVPKQQWPDQRTRLADRVAAALDESQRKQVRAAILDFLDRVHELNETQIRAQAADLWQSVTSLVPPELPVLGLLQDVDPASVRRRAAPLFVDPLTPGLLQEMAAARGWHVQ